MNEMKKANISYQVIFTLCLLVFSSWSSGSVAQVKELYIYHTNDTHSRIEPIDLNSSDRNVGAAGYVRRATLMAQLRQENPDLLLFDCGDFSQGTPYYNLYKGEVEVKLMNAIGYHAATIGNHEFDFGLENMARLFQMADFPIVCANYDFTGTVLESIVRPYIVLERKGIKIGVFGLSPKLEGLVQQSNCEGVVFLDPVEKANEIASYLRTKENCDVVICLSHLGLRPSALNQDSDEVLIRNTSHLDLVLGGHSHTFMDQPEIILNKEGQGVPVSQMGKNGVYVGEFRLSLSPKN